MLFLYLPFIIFETLMLSPRKRNVRLSLHRNVALCCRTQQLSGRRTMRVIYLKTKQVELLRILFSIGLTAFVGVGTFMTIRYLVGLSE